MDKIDYVELVLADFSHFTIKNENILECNLITKMQNIDYSMFGETPKPTNLIESLLLVVDDYSKMINDDNKDFDINKKNICEIKIHYRNNKYRSAYASMSTNETNNNQTNCLKDNRLYITIEDEKLS